MKRDQAILGKNGWQHFLDGQEVTQEEYEKRYPPPEKCSGPSSFIAWKPLESDALAVHPSQIKEAMEMAQARGVPTSFTPDGRPILTSRSHRKAYMQAHGFFDRDAGYSDAQYTGKHQAPEINDY